MFIPEFVLKLSRLSRHSIRRASQPGEARAGNPQLHGAAKVEHQVAVAEQGRDLAQRRQRPAISENAHDAYSNAVRVHLVPALGGHKLTTSEPEHLERLHRAMVQRALRAEAPTRCTTPSAPH